MEEYVYKNNKKLRCGYTTGSCAAAAALAAARMLLGSEKIKYMQFMTPKKVALQLEICDIVQEKDSVSCAVLKDGGDDADITDGAFVYAKVQKQKAGIKICGGNGIGVVTKPGLQQPVGEPAINEVPRKMITEALQMAAKEHAYAAGFLVTVSIPNGKALAAKTFNPRLGIVGGLSILGTTGIVEPMSEDSLKATILAEMQMHKAKGERDILMTPGNYGKTFLNKELGLNLDTTVQCSNFIGDSLDMAYGCAMQSILLIGHIGKLVKLGAGIMNTHSLYADGRMEVLCACAIEAGVSPDICKRILKCITTDEALALLREDGVQDVTMKALIERIAFHLRKRADESIEVAALIFSNQYGILGMTENAEKLLNRARNNMDIAEREND